MSISLIFGGFGFRDHCFTVEAFTNPTPTPAAGVSICIIFQLDFEIFRTIASFIKISSEHSLVIKLIFIKFFRTIEK